MDLNDNSTSSSHIVLFDADERQKITHRQFNIVMTRHFFEDIVFIINFSEMRQSI